MTVFCNYLTGYAGTCGCPVLDEPETGRCKRHRKLAKKEARSKIGRYSGPSKIRLEEGYKS